jgi:NhaP-type Na+/H+ and K+/H+ antiporter
VAARSRAVGLSVRELPLGEGGWVQAVERAGTAQRPRGSTTIQAGDALDVLAPTSDLATLRRLFADEPERPSATPS